jgi:hypothetical protein
MSNTYSSVTQYTKISKKATRDYQVQTLDGISCLTVKDHLVFVDESDLELVLRYNWNIHYRKGKLVGVEYRNQLDGRISLPQVLFGNPDGAIFHHNGDHLDNRRENLYVRHKKKNGPKVVVEQAQSFMGVRYIGGRNPYQAYLDSKVIGCYLTPEGAAAARDVAAFETYGNKAQVNL